MLKQSSSRSLLAPAAEGTSPKVRWGQDVNLDDKEEVEEEIGGASRRVTECRGNAIRSRLQVRLRRAML